MVVVESRVIQLHAERVQPAPKTPSINLGMSINSFQLASVLAGFLIQDGWQLRHCDICIICSRAPPVGSILSGGCNNSTRSTVHSEKHFFDQLEPFYSYDVGPSHVVVGVIELKGFSACIRQAVDLET